jgi:hypothetical protein
MFILSCLEHLSAAACCHEAALVAVERAFLSAVRG